MRIFTLLFLLLISACSTPTSSTPDATDGQITLRANPTYVHWLESQSLWHMAPQLNKIVQGNSLGWQYPSMEQGKDIILSSVPTWIHLDPWEIITKEDGNIPILLSLYNENFCDLLPLMNIQGVYLSPAAQPAIEWALDQSTPESTISYNFADFVATDEIYTKWQQKNIFMAGDILSPSLGIGPDFLLAIRGVRDYPSLFMMTEIPREFWPEDELSNSRALKEEEKSILHQNGLLPQAFSRDHQVYSTPGGFAITPPTVGIDGNSKRWVYRYHNDPSQPILHMDTPTQSSQIILSASIIHQVGVLQQPLAGINIAPLWAQEASLKGENLTPEPATSTMRSWNRSIHRYGGWSLLRNPLPMNYIPSLLAEGCDFVPDTIIMPALQKSLLEADSTYLMQNLQRAFDLKIDFSALWRASTASYGEEIFVSELMQSWENSESDTNYTVNESIWSEKTLELGAGLAASLVELSPEDVIIISKRIQQNIPLDTENKYEKELMLKWKEATQIQYSFITFSAMLPGLFMLDGHDLTGTVLVPEQLNSLQKYELPAWTPIQNKENTRRIATSKGIPKAYSLQAPLNIQLRNPESLASKVSNVLAIRQKTGVAQGKLIGIAETNSDKTFGLVTLLQDNSFLLTYINLSPEKIITKIQLPIAESLFYTVNDLLADKTIHIQNESISLTTEPWQVHILQISNPQR